MNLSAAFPVRGRQVPHLALGREVIDMGIIGGDVAIAKRALALLGTSELLLESRPLLVQEDDVDGPQPGAVRVRQFEGQVGHRGCHCGHATRLRTAPAS